MFVRKILTTPIFVLVLGTAAFAAIGGWWFDRTTELRLEDVKFYAFLPSERYGVKVIEIERSRRINVFGFLGAKAYAYRINFDEIRRRGGIDDGDYVQYTLKVEKGRITNLIAGGYKNLAVAEYLLNTIKKWEQSEQRFTSFVDGIEFLLKIYNDGVEIKYKDFQITQPIGEEESYRDFYTITRDRGMAQYFIPTAGFGVKGVTIDESIQQNFENLETVLSDWRDRLMPESLRRPVMSEKN